MDPDHRETPKRLGRDLLARPFEFSTDDIAPRERFDAWRSMFCPFHDVEVDAEERAAFQARASHRALGPFVFGEYWTSSRRVTRTATHAKRDYMDHWILRINRSARLAGRRDGLSHHAGAGEIHLETFATSYDFDHSAGDWVAVFVPRDADPELSAGLERIGPGAVSHGASGLLASFLTTLSDGLPDAPPDAMHALADATRSMITGCLLTRGLPDPVPAPFREHVLRNRAKSVILENIGSARLDPGRISELSGIGRSTLYRIFAAEGGVTAYVQDLRLKLVHSDLRNPAFGGERIATLAERRGFHNASSFNRAFRSKFGRTPGDVRAAASARSSDGCPREDASPSLRYPPV